MIFPEHRESPEPWDPDDGLYARLDAAYDATADRQERERRERARREFELRYPRPEARHTGSDDGLHHRPWEDPRSAELDMLARQREDPEQAYERGRAEAKADMAAARGPMTASEVRSWLAANGSYNGGPA